MEQAITLTGADGLAQPPPAPLGHLLAEVPEAVRQCISMRFRRRSKVTGRPPGWLAAASDVRFVALEVGPLGATVRFDAPPLGEAAPELYEQGELIPQRPDPRDTGFDLLGDLLTDVTRRDENSERFDPPLLKSLRSLRHVIDGTYHELRLTSRRFPVDRAALATADTIVNAREMYDRTPAPRRLRLVGELDALRLSTGTFALKLDDGNEVKGVIEPDKVGEVLALFGSRARVLVRGQAIFRPSGQLLLVDAEDVSSGDDEPALWSALPSFAKGDVLSSIVHQRQTKRRGVAAIIGQWPGDETDEEIEAALRELS